MSDVAGQESRGHGPWGNHKVSGLPHYWQWFTCILTPVADVEEGRCPIFLVMLHMPQDWAPPVKALVTMPSNTK